MSKNLDASLDESERPELADESIIMSTVCSGFLGTKMQSTFQKRRCEQDTRYSALLRAASSTTTNRLYFRLFVEIWFAASPSSQFNGLSVNIKSRFCKRGRAENMWTLRGYETYGKGRRRRNSRLFTRLRTRFLQSGTHTRNTLSAPVCRLARIAT